MNPLPIELAGCKAKPWDKIEPLFDDDDYVAERKMNGWRFAHHFGQDLDRSYFTGRRVSKKTGEFSEKGELVPMLWADPGLKYTVLDGEIMPPEGANFRDIAGIMNAEPDVSAANVRRLGPPEYHVFDCLFYDGEDVRTKPQWHRRSLANRTVEMIDNYLCKMVIEETSDQLGFFEREVAGGGEGIVLKFAHAPYGEGWIKVKRLHTLDVVIMGFTEARFGKTGKYDGLIGAIEVGVLRDGKLVQVGQVSGMNDQDRRWFTTNRNELKGRVIAIKAQEWAKNKLMHPRYKMMRDDIGPDQCTWDKLMRDLEAGAGSPSAPEQLEMF